jgi:hypothetical protein
MRMKIHSRRKKKMKQRFCSVLFWEEEWRKSEQ